MSNSAELFKKLTSSRQGKAETAHPPELPKRGRPPGGKRSNPDWLGRTYYIRRETDLDLEGELLQLRRQGIEMDKSELVDSLLDAWLKWRQGENIESRLAEISPRQKDGKD